MDGIRRLVTTCILITIILLSGTFSLLYYEFNLQEPSNSINQTFRKKVLPYPFLRRILRLNQVGDARFDFFAKRYSPVEIYLYYQEGTALENQAIEKAVREIQFITHKYPAIKVRTPIILSSIPDKVQDQDIESLLRKYDTNTPWYSPSVSLHIFLLKYYLPHPSYAGLVTNAHSLLLFKTAMDTIADDQDTLISIETSTILHEFAHLGGADHIQNTECIMADTVENLNFYNKIKHITDSYCQEDLDAIRQALK